MIARDGAVWHDGYCTALKDFGIRVTEDDIENRISKNPHGDRIGRRRLTEYERREIRTALGYHFDDCPVDFDLQAEIVTTVVERILSRRPERAA